MNRFLIYGDLLFETIKVEAHIPCFLLKHYNRLMFGAKILGFETEGFNFEKFESEILKSIKEYVLNQKQEANLLRLRFVMYRNSNGFYLPATNQIDYFITILPYEAALVQHNLKVGIFEEQLKSTSSLSNIKSGNALLYVLAINWAKQQNLDDALLMNTNKNLVEASSSNLFWLKNKQWFTPPLIDGCVRGVMREVFMEQNSVIEKSCSINDLVNADKRMLSNTLQGYRFFDLY